MLNQSPPANHLLRHCFYINHFKRCFLPTMKTVAAETLHSNHSTTTCIINLGITKTSATKTAAILTATAVVMPTLKILTSTLTDLVSQFSSCRNLSCLDLKKEKRTNYSMRHLVVQSDTTGLGNLRSFITV